MDGSRWIAAARTLRAVDATAGWSFPSYGGSPLVSVGKDAAMVFCEVGVHGAFRLAHAFMDTTQGLSVVDDAMYQALSIACAMHGVRIEEEPHHEPPPPPEDTFPEYFGSPDVLADDRQRGNFESYYEGELAEALARFGAESVDRLTVAQYQAAAREWSKHR